MSRIPPTARAALIRLASTLDKGSPERRTILAGLRKASSPRYAISQKALSSMLSDAMERAGVKVWQSYRDGRGTKNSHGAIWDSVWTIRSQTRPSKVKLNKLVAEMKSKGFAPFDQSSTHADFKSGPYLLSVYSAGGEWVGSIWRNSGQDPNAPIPID